MPKIDFVLPWVDGNDPEWQKLFNKYSPVKRTVVEEDYNNKKRYDDTGLLRYWFRCVEKNAPWINKVFFITNGQKPDWLNLNCNKLVWVKHEDYIPKKYLPVFSANPIEVNLHRIKELSECFAFFNDDCFIINKIKKSYYFNNDCLPCDFAIQREIPASLFGHLIINNLSEINARFNKKDVISQNINKWFNLKYGIDLFHTFYYNQAKTFTGFLGRHTSQAFLKSTFEEVWENCNSVLHETSSNRFRSVTDVTQYLFRYWQIVTGKFNPASVKGRRIWFDKVDIKELKKCFFNHKIKEVCINYDVPTEALKLFEKYYPEKSMFEL